MTTLNSNVVDIRNQGLQSLAVSSTSASKQVQEHGIYDIWCATEVSIVIRDSSSFALTATTGYILRANNTVPFAIDSGQYIIAITASASDTLYFMKVGNKS